MRKWLREVSPDEELIDEVCDQLMYFVNKYTIKTFEPFFNLVAPPGMTGEQADALLASIDKGFAEMNRQVNDMINQIIVERFFVELELYDYRSGNITIFARNGTRSRQKNLNKHKKKTE